MTRPTVLCPVDLSENSRGALRYAAAVASHFGTRLTLLFVTDPLLHEAAALSGTAAALADETRAEIDQFLASTFDDRPHGIAEVVVEIATGKPAREILRASEETRSDLIVMSSHGATGFRKLFFGSTTERVLRETRVPVLVTPGEARVPLALEDITRRVRRILAPVDLTPASTHQVAVAGGLADALGVSLLLLHVIEPVSSPLALYGGRQQVLAERRHRAEAELERIVNAAPGGVQTEALVAYGEPAEEIAKVAGDRNAGLIVMGLHSSQMLGPRMGSVTYRVLCMSRAPVLALPPLPVASARAAVQTSYAYCQAVLATV